MNKEVINELYKSPSVPVLCGLIVFDISEFRL